jgi:hypothetical protein
LSEPSLLHRRGGSQPRQKNEAQPTITSIAPRPAARGGGGWRPVAMTIQEWQNRSQSPNLNTSSLRRHCVGGAERANLLPNTPKEFLDLHFHQNPKLRPAGIQEPFAHRKPTSRERKLAARVWLRRALRLGGTVALYGGTLAVGMLWGWWATAH